MMQVAATPGTRWQLPVTAVALLRLTRLDQLTAYLENLVDHLLEGLTTLDLLAIQ